MANFALVHDGYISHQSERVLSFITQQTCKKGFATTQEVIRVFNISNPDLIEIRDLLISQGKIEIVP